MIKKSLSLLLMLCLVCAAIPGWAEGAAAPNATESATAAPEAEEFLFGPFSAENLNGDGPVTEAAFADAKITLVNVWATWCPPCIAELPDLAKLNEATGGDVQVISVLLDALDDSMARDEDAIEAMEALVKDAGVTYPVLYPDDFLLAVGYSVSSIPTTFIVDEQGILINYAVGARSLEEWIDVANTVAQEVYGGEVTIAQK